MGGSGEREFSKRLVDKMEFMKDKNRKQDRQALHMTHKC